MKKAVFGQFWGQFEVLLQILIVINYRYLNSASGPSNRFQFRPLVRPLGLVLFQCVFQISTLSTVSISDDTLRYVMMHNCCLFLSKFIRFVNISVSGFSPKLISLSWSLSLPLTNHFKQFYSNQFNASSTSNDSRDAFLGKPLLITSENGENVDWGHFALPQKNLQRIY